MLAKVDESHAALRVNRAALTLEGRVQSMGTAHVTRTILRFLVFGAVGCLLSTGQALAWHIGDRKSTRLNSSH